MRTSRASSRLSPLAHYRNVQTTHKHSSFWGTREGWGSDHWSDHCVDNCFFLCITWGSGVLLISRYIHWVTMSRETYHSFHLFFRVGEDTLVNDLRAAVVWTLSVLVFTESPSIAPSYRFSFLLGGTHISYWRNLDWNQHCGSSN